MAPLADCLNHTSDKQNTFFFVNKKLHVQEPNQESFYSKDNKHENDISLIYQNDDAEDLAALKTEVVKGRVATKSKQARLIEDNLDTWKKQAEEEGKQAWELQFDQ